MIEEKNKTEASTLYLVATPIGNLADLSDRAKKILTEVDFVAAEDTRNSAKLLACFGIHNELVSYHEHNKRQSGERIVARLLEGKSCALITDAGMPAISDPGEDLVALCAESGVTVRVIPGCCAAVSALSLSALPTGRFVFEGFLPVQKGERKERLGALINEERTIIFYEAPHKLKNTLADLAEAFGKDRRISLCRELTKLNEEIIRTDIKGAIAVYEEKEPRGEYVLVVEGGSGRKEESELALLSPEEHVEFYISGGMKRMDAIKLAAKERGVSKSVLYKQLLDE